MKKFVLAHGLPGSGKTTLLKKLVAKDIENGDDTEYLDLDKEYHENNLDGKIRDALMYNDYDRRHSNGFGYDAQRVIAYVDMLCLTNKELANLIYALMKRYILVVEDKNFEFTILDFEPNRELCLKNDMIRSYASPSRSAKVTIENGKFESLDTELISSLVGDQLAAGIDANCAFHVKVKQVPVWNSDEASPYERTKAYVYGAANSLGTVVKNILRGESWIIGGKEWSYTGKEWAVGGQEPEKFDTFDDMMTALCPNISFLNYKKVRNVCCDVEEYYEHDYYSSYEKNRWICDLDKLVSILDEMELLS